MKLQFWVVRGLCCVAALLWQQAGWASSGGITGYSGNSSTCASCHTGTPYNYSGTISVGGSSASHSVEEGTVNSLTFAMTKSSGSDAVRVGFNLSATGGSLSESSAVIQLLSSELTQLSPRTPTAGDYTFSSMSWTAPAAAASSNTHTLYACGNPVDNDGGSGSGDGAPACDTIAITVYEVPTISGVDGTLAYTENDGAQTVDSALTITDTDSTNLNRAEVGISANFASTEDTLTASATLCSLYSLSCSFSSGTGVLTITGTGTKAEYDAVLQSVTYTNSSDDPSTSTRTVRFRVRDSGNHYSAYDSKSITVAAENDAPTISNINTVLAYTENAGALVIDSSITVADADGTQFNRAEVEVSANYASPEDTLTANASLCASYSLSCSFSVGLLSITGTATHAQYDAVLQSVTYTNSSDDPSTSTRTVRYRVRDTSSSYSGYDTTTVTVAASNDAPVFGAPAPSTSATEAVEYAYTAVVTDPDDSGFGAELTLTLNSAVDNNAAALTGVSFNTTTGLLTWTPPNGVASPVSFEIQVEDGDEDGSGPTVQSWSVSADAINDPPSITTTASTTATEDNVYTYVADATDPDDLNNGTDLTWSLINEPAGMSVSATGTVSWTPTEGVSSSGLVTLRVADGGENSAAPDDEAFTIAVTAVNDPPVISAVPTVQPIEETPYQFDVLVSDPDDSNWTFSLSGAPSGMAIDPGTGRISWTPAEGVLTTGTVTINAADSGADGALPDSAQFTLAVTPVNDQPSISSVAVTTATEDTLYQYQLAVSDADIPADTHTYDFTVNPAGMLVSAGGLIQWTPTEAGPAQTTPYLVNVTARASDGLEDGVIPAQQPYLITVTPVNDTPLVVDESNQQVTELSAFNLSLSVTDPDDLNNGSSLTWTPVSLPLGMTLGSTGALAWTPGQNTSGITGVAFTDYPVTVQVTDGGENGAVPDQMSFTLRVNKLDSDSDLVADYNDNCPLGAVDPADADDDPDQTDTDNDSVGNLCDLDDDNDGIEDIAEVSNGLNPLDPADAALDLDGDGLSNLDEFNACSGTAAYPLCTNIALDSVAPVITLANVMTVASSGYLTAVTPVVSAVDGIEGVTSVYVVEQNGVAVSPVIEAGNVFALRPGRHLFVWESQDSEGNTSQENQTIDVLPRLSVANSQTVGEGQLTSVRFRLNGDAPTYPVQATYSLTGTASVDDVAALSGVISFASGIQEIDLPVSVLSDGVAEGDELLQLEINPASISLNAVASDALLHRMLIVERQVAPEVSLEVTQNGRSGSVVYAGDGPVTVAATTFDANDDVVSLAWQSSNPAIVLSGVSASQTFDPSALDGSYAIVVQADDGVAIAEQSVALVVKTVVPVLSGASDQDGDGVDDLSEGASDSDSDYIPDYLDALAEPFSLPYAASTDGVSQGALITTDEGLELRLGATAIEDGSDGAQVSSALINRDELFSVVGAIVDFEVHGLNEVQREAYVVVPLTQPVLPDAVYRKYHDGEWQTFIEDGHNAVASAAREEGVCPAISSLNWVAGLRPSVTCVRLLLSDGGPNDTDGVVNGVIRDPGGVAVEREPKKDTSVPSSGPNNGAGGLGMWWIAVLLMAIKRRKLRR